MDNKLIINGQEIAIPKGLMEMAGMFMKNTPIGIPTKSYSKEKVLQDKPTVMKKIIYC